MSDVVVVAIVTAAAATVPQILTWAQNLKRDGWERTRAEATEKRDAEEREHAAESAAVEARRHAYSECLESAVVLLAETDDTTPLQRTQHYGYLLRTWTDALFVATDATRPTIEGLLSAFPLEYIPAPNLKTALAAHRAKLVTAIRNEADPYTHVGRHMITQAQ